MGNFDNYLGDADLERLAILAEEAGELVQTIGKIIRHGYESHNPDRPQDGDNRHQLCRELGDMKFIVELMERCGDFEADRVADFARSAADKKRRYLHHQPEF